MSFKNDDEEANEGYRGNYSFMDLYVSTTNISVYTPETMKETILSLENALDKKIKDAIAKLVGSGWAIDQCNKICIVLRTHKTAGSGSYIKTPENISILNVD